MPEFLDTLSIYYVCDAMAATRPLDTAEMAGCMDVYERVKRHFLDAALKPFGTAERAEQMRRAYMDFVAWQSANATLVADLRAAAAARLLEMVPARLR